jgi:predicted Zn-dependent protease
MTLPIPHPPSGCSCPLHARRLFTALLATGALAAPALAQQAQEGVRGDVGQNSVFTNAVSAKRVEAQAAQEYTSMLRQAAAQHALAPASDPQVQRLRAIAQRIIPFTGPWNARAAQWKWEVNLLMSAELNAFCMPGGKIAFFHGILKKLQLSDDEVATVMGHEVAHALREHARERMGAALTKQLGVELGAALFGWGNTGRTIAGGIGQLATLEFGREDETEADIVGMELAARAGYDPAAGVTLWQKMLAASKGAPLRFLSTHPAGKTRIRDIQDKLPKVQPLFARAPKPERRYAPPPAA